MEAIRKIPFVIFLITFLIVGPRFSHEAESSVAILDEDNWTRILENEWIVEFMAPWCPACTALKPTWRQLGQQARGLAIRVGEVDVTTSPGLSGRFLVTALPTIYHVINGEFRQYKGPRDIESLVSYVEASKWRAVEPVSWWKDPTRLHMAVVSQFFRLSHLLRTVHNILLETYGLPTFGSYLIFAIITIILGAIFGLIVVCLIDIIYPPKGSNIPPKPVSESPPGTDDDLVDESGDDHKKDDDDQQDSDDEKYSGSDTQSSESESNSQPKEDEEEGGQGDDNPADANKKAAGSPAEVRKRKPRKAE